MDSLHKIPINREDFRKVFDMTTHLVHMKGTKVRPKLPLPVRSYIGKVLVSEKNDTALCGEEGELIPLSGVERAQLDTL